MAATFTVSHPKKGLDELVARVRSVEKKQALDVGVHKEEAHARTDGGPSNAQLASWHEFGSMDGHLPARPFLRPTFTENAAKYKAFLAREYQQFLKGKTTAHDALLKLGTNIVADIQTRILRGIAPKLLPGTVARKKKAGMPRPHTALYASGSLFHAIKARLAKGLK